MPIKCMFVIPLHDTSGIYHLKFQKKNCKAMIFVKSKSVRKCKAASNKETCVR